MRMYGNVYIRFGKVIVHGRGLGCSDVIDVEVIVDLDVKDVDFIFEGGDGLLLGDLGGLSLLLALFGLLYELLLGLDLHFDELLLTTLSLALFSLALSGELAGLPLLLRLFLLLLFFFLLLILILGSSPNFNKC